MTMDEINALYKIAGFEIVYSNAGARFEVHKAPRNEQVPGRTFLIACGHLHHTKQENAKWASLAGFRAVMGTAATRKVDLLEKLLPQLIEHVYERK